MKIGIDGNTANVSNPVGVSVYTSELLSYFYMKADEDTQFEVYLKSLPQKHLPPESKFFTYRIVSPSYLWSYVSLPKYLKSNPPDVLFSPAHYSPLFATVPTVVTVHDFAYKYFPHEFLKRDLLKLEYWTAYSIKRARKVICVSQSTKNDLEAFFHTQSGKASIIYNGFTPRHTTGKQSKAVTEIELRSVSDLITTQPFFLFVGTIQPRKNVSGLIKAFETFSSTHPDYRLLIVGKKGWLFDKTLRQIATSHAKDKIHYLNSVTDSALATLYSHAFSLVLPSFYEGFGLPVLEAMSNSLPVIASKNSSLPEVGGSAALYVDPADPQSIVKAMTKITDEKQRIKMIEKGKLQIKKFSWSKCGEETLALLRTEAKKYD